MYDVYDFLKNPTDFPFDIESTPDKFNYFEALMDEEGNVFEAPNGHSQGALVMLANKKGIRPSEVNDLCPSPSFWHEWLLRESGAVMIWFNQCQANSLNEKQLATLKKLQEKGHIQQAFHCTTYHYNDVHNNPEYFFLNKDNIKN